MPWWYRNRYNRWNWRRRRPRYRRYFRRRRTTKTFRPRWGLYRRRHWVRKRKYRKYRKRKLKSIVIRQFQPDKIVKAQVKGTICLYQCGPDRLHFNWTQYMQTVTPEYWQGGGGWSQIKFSLGSLYQQHEFMSNIWTKSNVALPLVRYYGCTFKFYRNLDIDYIVWYSTCLPMLDNVMLHATAQPANMLMRKHKIIVKSLRTKPNGPLYVKKRIRPPQIFQNHWYFQKELCNEGLLLLTTTPIDLQRYYLNPESCSNSITLTCINPSLFQNHNFQQSGLGTRVWSPSNDYYLYGAIQEPHKVGDLIYLGQTRTNEPGKSINTAKDLNAYKKDFPTNFGNPFFHRYTDDTYIVYSSLKSLDETWNLKDQLFETHKNTYSPISQPILQKVRYCPGKDKGDTNTIYLIKVTDYSNWDPPADPDLKFSGFPLWTLFWGWTDWQKKLKKAINIHSDYLVCFQTGTITEKLKAYCPLDDSYIHGNSPYQKDNFNIQDWDIWWPSERYQMTSIENICKTGPGVAKTTSKSLEAHCNYTFFFKWGGCPKQIENITDPCNQPDYPIPHTELQTPEAQDPETDPTKELYKFDFRRDTITPTAAKRLKKDTKTSTFISTDTNKCNSEPTIQDIQTFEKENETSSEEEEKAPLQQQLELLRHHRKSLRLRINRLISHTPSIKL
nr:MAG: ORF1 [TTV-like mini virus]